MSHYLFNSASLNIGMQHAYTQACQAYEALEVPVGAALIHNQRILVANHNRMRQNRNPLDHAEILVIREGLSKLNSQFLDQCILCVTLEPCPMCLESLRLVRVQRIYFGSYAPETFQESPRHQGLLPWGHHYYGGFYEMACSSLLTRFFSELR